MSVASFSLPLYTIAWGVDGDEAFAYGIAAARVAALTLLADNGNKDRACIYEGGEAEGYPVEFAEMGPHGPYIRGGDTSRGLL